MYFFSTGTKPYQSRTTLGYRASGSTRSTNKTTNRITEILFMKKTFTILAIAAVHFAVTKFISSITLSVVTANVHSADMPLTERLLMLISKVLYFPVMTMAFYPRRFFPGNLVMVPLFINSLLWALVIYTLVVLIKKIVSPR
jgi:hypothetical protein